MQEVAPIHNQYKELCGFWLKNPENAYNSTRMLMLVTSFQGTASQRLAAQLGNFRVVPNRVDNNGGVFVMFDGSPAPGEK